MATAIALPLPALLSLLLLSQSGSAQNIVRIESVSVSPSSVRRGAKSNCTWASVQVAVEKGQDVPNPTLVLSVFKSLSRPSEIQVDIKPEFVQATLPGPMQFHFRVCTSGDIPGTIKIRAAINGVHPPEVFTVVEDASPAETATSAQITVEELEPVPVKAYLQLSSVEFTKGPPSSLHLDPRNGPTCTEVTVHVHAYRRTQAHADPVITLHLFEHMPSPRRPRVDIVRATDATFLKIPIDRSEGTFGYRVCAVELGVVTLKAAITNVYPSSHYDVQPAAPATNAELSFSVVP